MRSSSLAAVLAAVLLAGCASSPPPVASVPGAATDATRAHQAAVARAYDLRDGDAMADARRGFIAAPTGPIRAADGRVVWDFDSFGFVTG